MGKRNYISLPGNRFGRLLVLCYHDTVKKNTFYTCMCDCGKECVVNGKYLRLGDTRSCGCLKAQRQKENMKPITTHGLTKHPLYKVWTSMKDRCLNPKCHAYKDYGGRGIGISQEWLSFKSFYDDVIGTYQKGLELDRTDNNGSYGKDNFRWATPVVNKRNRRNSVLLEVNGVTKHISEWAEETGISVVSIRHRIKSEGKTGEEALYGTILKRRVLT